MNPNFIAWIIITLGALTLWHAVYELILLPSFRRSIRFRLFALRDRLREFKSEHSNQCSDEAFHLLDDMLSWQTDHLPRLTYQLLERSAALLRENSVLRDEVARRMQTLNSCKLEEYVSIRKESSQLVLRTMALNSGGWIVYLVPIVYSWIIGEKIFKSAQRLSAMPSEQVERLQGCPA